ncbi:MAG: DUF1549 domain-containing protein [Planctomycetaceae bacterium]
MRSICAWICWIAAASGIWIPVQPLRAEPPVQLTLRPSQIRLESSADRQQILVTSLIDGYNRDLTREVEFDLQPAGVATIDEQGVVRPQSDGAARLVARWKGSSTDVPVVVSGATQHLPIDFERDLMPIFSRAGCNAGACHGKARGQNGFQLSLLGFDAQFDYDAITREGRGRRVFLADPRRSLLLTKPTGQTPHGGGRRLPLDSESYRMLRRWISDGLPRRHPQTPQLQSVTVTPTEAVMPNQASQQLVVTALYSDGSTRDVTHMAAYQSNESGVASVDNAGLVVAGTIMGEAAIMARYEGKIAVARVPIPHPDPIAAAAYADLPSTSFVDKLVWDQLTRLRITPSEAAPDHKFLRRAAIDIIGRLPTLEESQGFFDDPSPNKRVRLVDYLLDQPEYADHWANKWADLLRPNPYRVGIKAVLNYDAWIRSAFRRNQPYDQFVTDLITARGSTFRNGAVTLFRDRRSPDELTTIVSQLFLGIRLECAKCHHHPFEVWGQEDFYSFAAFFARVGRKGTGLSPPISGSEEFIYTGTGGSVSHPLTGKKLSPRPLFGDHPEIGADQDPRQVLAAWMTSDENPFFAQVMANRVWADLMGRGLVEPVDDLRATNPASNSALLEALGRDFRDHRFDIKHLIRRITTSAVYGLSSLPTARNVADTRNYSRHYRQRIRAEVMLDSLSQITEVRETFSAMPHDGTAKQIWTHRVGSLFLDAFGRPDPNQDPPCERNGDTTVVQALHLMNSENLFKKVTSDSGRAARLAASQQSVQDIVNELYLVTFSRRPTSEEQAITEKYFATEGLDRRGATQDLLWALLNTPEFVYKD